METCWKCQASFPSPAVAGHGLCAFWGQNMVGCVGRPAPFIPQCQARVESLLGPGYALMLPSQTSLPFSKSTAGEISWKNQSAGDTQVGLALEWGGLWLWISHCTRPGSPRGLCTWLCLCPASPQLVQQLPPPLHPPQTHLARLQSRDLRGWETSPGSALQRADNDMLTCLFVPLPHSLEM